MAELDFTDLAAMNSLVTELSGLAPSDLDSLLTQSAGTHTDDSVTVYRPYYAAAVLLRRALNTKRLRGADGAQFDSPAQTIAGFMRQQASEDARLADEFDDWAVPEGHAANSAGSSRVTF